MHFSQRRSPRGRPWPWPRRSSPWPRSLKSLKIALSSARGQPVLKRAFNPNFEKLQENLKKYVYQHDPIAILATHPVKKV